MINALGGMVRSISENVRGNQREREDFFKGEKAGFLSIVNLGQPVTDASHKNFQFLRFQPRQELQVDFRSEDSFEQFYEFALSYFSALESRTAELFAP